MGTDNFAYGYGNQDVPWLGMGAGNKTEFGMVLPSSARIAAFVRSTGRVDLDPPEISNRIDTTLAAGLKKCRAGYGDAVIVLPGHSESVTGATMMDNLVNGTRIIGWGSPLQDDAPTLNFTAAASQWVMDNKNVLIRGLKLKFSMTTPFVTKGIVFTAAGCSMLGNVIETSTTSTAGAAIAMEVGSGASQFTFAGNYVYGTIGTFQTDVLKVAAAVNDLVVIRNRIMAPATIATGVINIGANACLRVYIADNILSNTLAASTACISAGNAASSGDIVRNYCSVLNDGTGASQGIILHATSLIRCYENRTSDENGKTGIVTPAAVAT